MIQQRFESGQEVEVLKDGTWQKAKINGYGGTRFDANMRGVAGEPDVINNYSVLLSANGLPFIVTKDEQIRPVGVEPEIEQLYDVYGEDNKPFCTLLNINVPVPMKKAEQIKEIMETVGWRNIRILPTTR